MNRWLVLLCLIPAVALGYNPSPAELLSKMEAGWRKVKAVPAHLRLYDGSGQSLGERPQAVAAQAAPAPKDPEGFVSFTRFLAGGDYLAAQVPTLLAADATTGVGRLDTTICYRLEGRTERAWLRKADLVPVKVERLVVDGVWEVTSFLDIVLLEDRYPYPARTEFVRAGKLLFVETLIRDAAQPPAP